MASNHSNLTCLMYRQACLKRNDGCVSLGHGEKEYKIHRKPTEVLRVFNLRELCQFGLNGTVQMKTRPLGSQLSMGRKMTKNASYLQIWVIFVIKRRCLRE